MTQERRDTFQSKDQKRWNIWSLYFCWCCVKFSAENPMKEKKCAENLKFYPHCWEVKIWPHLPWPSLQFRVSCCGKQLSRGSPSTAQVSFLSLACRSWVSEASRCLANPAPSWGRTFTAAWRTCTTTGSTSSTWQRGASCRSTVWWVSLSLSL